MSDLLLNFIVIAGSLILASAIFVFYNQKQKRELKDLTQIANQNGWKIAYIRKPLEKGFKITAREWTIESIMRSGGRESGPGSTDWEQKTTWFASKPGTTILIGPRNAQMDMPPIAVKLAHQIFQAALGADADRLKEVHIGSSAFQEKFMVWAQDPERIDSFLTPGVQYALMRWKSKPPLIKRTSRGTSIELDGIQFKNPEDLNTLINLGEQLL
jgi:hypothetical protein